MTAKDRPVSQPATDKYRAGHDRIFGKRTCQRCGKTLLPENYIHTCSPQVKKQEDKNGQS